MQEYNNESIDLLEGATRLRTRPESMLGSNGLAGAQHTVYEIIGNATDEKLAGYGDSLDVYRYSDGSIAVRDYGRGVPLGLNTKYNKWNYYLIYEELFAGGKYNDNQEVLRKIDEEDSWDTFRLEDYPYLITIGLNGLGAAATQCTSEYCIVESYRADGAYRMEYEKGTHILDELKVLDNDKPHGTFVHWKPDARVFKDTNITANWLSKLCFTQSYLSGFDVRFYNDGELTEYKKSSLLEVMQESVGKCFSTTSFTHTKDSDGDICICQSEIVIGADGRTNEFFHNRVGVSGGVHSSSYSYAMSQFFSDVGRERGIKFRDSDYSGKFSVIISTLANKQSLHGQTKDSVDDPYIYDNLYSAIYKLLKQEYDKGTDWFMNIISKAESDARNRIAVAEMAKSLKDIERSTKKHKVSKKFSSCKSYEAGDVAKTEFFIVEGDSAGGKVDTSRDPSFQCFLAIRGKSLNVYKATIDKLLNNAEIKDMIGVLGCGVDLGIDGYQSFDISKLKVGKIVFLADADVDGKHITVLLFLIMLKLCPELLYQGYVYVAETPLYVILTRSNKQVYCMSYEEALQVKEELGAEYVKMDRFKGLGEADAKDLWDTTLNPETRRMRQIKIDRNDLEMYDVLEVLFGKSTDRRKRAILGNMLDVSFDDLMEEIDTVSDYIDGLGLNQLEVEDVEL